MEKKLSTVEPADSLASFPSADNRRRHFSNSIYGRIKRCWGAPNSLKCNQAASVFGGFFSQEEMESGIFINLVLTSQFWAHYRRPDNMKVSSAVYR